MIGLSELTVLTPFLMPIILLAIIFGLRYYFDKKRREALRVESVKIGFSFDEKGSGEFLAEMKTFNSFHKGYNHRIRNVLKGRRGGLNMSIFDYKYTTGGGDSSQRYHQTVIKVDMDSPIPDFYLTKELFFQKINKLFGDKDINFEESPEFSKKFFLSGANEPAVRKLFSPQVRSFFQGLDSKIIVEAKNNKLIIFKTFKIVKPLELNQFINDYSVIINVFKKEVDRTF
ncbi:MAG: hypothetical protein ABIB43_03585 [archaeon]